MHRHDHAGAPRRARRRVPVLVAFVAGVALAGCGSSGPSGATSSAAGASSATTSATSAAVTTAASTTTASTAAPSTVPSTTSTSKASGPTTTAADAKAAIAANWERFFAASTPLAEREALLENGAALHDALVTRSQDPLQQQASARVTAVELTSPNDATVTFDVLLSGQVVLPAAQGAAVLQAGVWKVSANSFCALVSLGATAPIPGCS